MIMYRGISFIAYPIKLYVVSSLAFKSILPDLSSCSTSLAFSQSGILLSRDMDTNPIFLSANCRFSIRNCGISLRHGIHQLAQKSIKIKRPLNWVNSSWPDTSCFRSNGTNESGAVNVAITSLLFIFFPRYWQMYL